MPEKNMNFLHYYYCCFGIFSFHFCRVGEEEEEEEEEEEAERDVHPTGPIFSFFLEGSVVGGLIAAVAWRRLASSLTICPGRKFSSGSGNLNIVPRITILAISRRSLMILPGFQVAVSINDFVSGRGSSGATCTGRAGGSMPAPPRGG